MSFFPYVSFAINNSCQSSTCESPFFLNSGHHPLAPSSFVDESVGRDFTCDQRPRQWLKEQEEALRMEKDAVKAAKTRQAFYSDRGCSDLEFNAGDHVLLHRQFLPTPEARDRPCDKLRPRWYGPFKIVKVINSHAFRLDLPHYMRTHPVINVSALKHYHRNEIVGRQVEPPRQSQMPTGLKASRLNDLITPPRQTGFEVFDQVDRISGSNLGA